MLKRFILACIAVCMVAATVPVTAFASEPTLEEKVSAYCENLGDTDGNGKVNVTDARKALRIAVGLESATAQELKNADIDNDGGVTVNDARNILRYAVNLSGFDVPNSVVTKAEVLNLFVTAAKKVKTEKPGLTRKTTMVTPSIK
ncbi:MAG TPA: dockerin type I repeat-containing protein, partial [Oscillospiraceae bacterium]|nr:dockerin type I repeat-containing protein [Oscillospiraceae bacterium]